MIPHFTSDSAPDLRHGFRRLALRPLMGAGGGEGAKPPSIAESDGARVRRLLADDERRRIRVILVFVAAAARRWFLRSPLTEAKSSRMASAGLPWPASEVSPRKFSANARRPHVR